MRSRVAFRRIAYPRFGASLIPRRRKPDQRHDLPTIAQDLATGRFEGAKSRVMKLALTILAVLGMILPARGAELALKEGDCWSYATRPGEEASYLVIQKIET